MQRNATDLDPTYIRTVQTPPDEAGFPNLLDLSVEDTILDPRALQGLPPELRALIQECVEESAETPDAQTRMGCLVPDDELFGLAPECEAPERAQSLDDELRTVMGYEELPLPLELPLPGSRAPLPLNLGATAALRPPPQSETAVMPREMSELSLVAPLSFLSESRVPIFPPAPAPIPLDLPALLEPVQEETREFERPISQPLVKVVSRPSQPPLEGSDPAYRVHAFGSRISKPGTPAGSRPKVEIPPQRYIHTVISYPRPGQVQRTAQRSLWARIKAWFLPRQPGFVDAPPMAYFGAKGPGRAPLPAR